jgi:hypothetical protein
MKMNVREPFQFSFPLMRKTNRESEGRDCEINSDVGLNVGGTERSNRTKRTFSNTKVPKTKR